MRYLGAIFTITLLFISSKSMAAGFYFEPALFYESGDGKVDIDSSKATTKGMGLDLKLGMHFVDNMLFVAADGSMSKPKFKHDNTGYDADATSSTYGAIIGVQTPLVGLRFWAGYVFGGTLDPEASGLFDVKFDEAKGPKVGLGIKIFFVALNFEYMDLKYSKGTGNWGSIPSLDDFENKVGMVSVSVPLNF